MKQIINQCLVAFFMILTVIILVFLLLIIPTSLASAETVSRDQMLKQDLKIIYKTKNFHHEW